MAMRSLVCCSLLLLVACADVDGAGEVAQQEYRTFQFEVFPVLLRDCGFPACHGSEDRFLRVYGPGRVRLSPETGALDQGSLSEVGMAHRLARSMIDPNDLEASPLLMKPLSVAAGGSGHGGVDSFGRDVYRTTQDHGYRVLRRWVYSLQTAMEQEQMQMQMQMQPAQPPPAQP